MLVGVENAGIRNEATGELGSVVQAGTIQQVTLVSSSPVPPGQVVVPRQLPGAVRDFTGRADHVVALDALFPADRTSEAAGALGAVVITAIDGAGGIGKTSLALYWAHRVQDRFPDGTLHVNLRGYGPGNPASPEQALDGFLRALGVPAEAIPLDADAKAGQYRSLLAGRRILIVLDNANHPDQVRPLLPGTSGCMVVVTSRDSLAGLVITDGAHRITLDLLTDAEAHELVSGILGPARVSAEPSAIAELVRLCTRLPLALRIAATRIGVSPDTSVADVVTELADDRSRLDVLSRGGDERTALRAVFDYSYQRLATDQAHLFRILGLHPGPEISVHAAAAVADLALQQARQRLVELADAHMIIAVGARRFRFHDLLRVYAYERSLAEDGTHERNNSTRLLADWYLRAAATADSIAFPGFFRSIEVAIEYTEGLPLPFADRDGALEWLDSERLNLISVVRNAFECGLDIVVIQFAEVTTRYFNLRAYWDDSIEVKNIGIAAAKRCGNGVAEAKMLHRRSEIAQMTRRFDEAVERHNQALNLAREVGDHWAEFASLNGLGVVLRELERNEEALNCFEGALNMCREDYGKRAKGVILSNMGASCSALGRFAEALDYGTRGLEIRRDSGDRWGEAVDLEYLGAAQGRLGEHLNAVDLYSEAVEIYREVGAQWQKAHALRSLGHALLQVEKSASAKECWQEALVTFEILGDPEAVRIRQELTTLGDIAK